MGDGDPKKPGETRALPAEMAGVFQELAQSFLALEHAASFYPVGHQARQVPLLRLHRNLQALMEQRDSLTLGFAEEELFWEGEFYGDISPLVHKLVAFMHEQGIAHITFRQGIGTDEIQGFISLLASRRSGGMQRMWAPGEEFAHIAIEGVDYRKLMAEESADTGDVGRRRDLWKSLIARCMSDAQADLSSEELRLLAAGEEWEDPKTLVAFILDGLGPAAWAGSAEAVEPMRRLTAALERAAAAQGAPTGAVLRDRFRKVGRQFPDPLRLRLLEASLGEPAPELFAKAFGSPSPADLVALLAKNFAMDTDQIARLTRVFQHLVPRQLERMELFPQIREQVRSQSTTEEALPENAWGEVQELLTGELGEFMSPSYRELMQRISSRETRRREAEDSLAALPDIFQSLAAGRIREETLCIQLELLGLATGEEQMQAALDRATGLCRNAFAAGDRAQGLLALRYLTGFFAAAEIAPSLRPALEAALRALAVPALLEPLIADFMQLADKDQDALVALLPFDPETAARGLVAAFGATEDHDQRRRLADLIASLGPPAVAEIRARLGTAPPGALRDLIGLLGDLKAEASVPALVALLGHPEPKVCREALRALIRIDTPEARRALPALLAGGDEELMQMAAAHLGAIGHQASRKELLRLLQRGNLAGLRTGEVRRAAIALGRMRASEAVAPLADLLRQRAWVSRHAQEDLCTVVAQALGRIGTAEAKKALEDAVGNAPAALAAIYRRLLVQWGKP